MSMQKIAGRPVSLGSRPETPSQWARAKSCLVHFCGSSPGGLYGSMALEHHFPTFSATILEEGCNAMSWRVAIECLEGILRIHHGRARGDDAEMTYLVYAVQVCFKVMNHQAYR